MSNRYTTKDYIALYEVLSDAHLNIGTLFYEQIIKKLKSEVVNKPINTEDSKKLVKAFFKRTFQEDSSEVIIKIIYSEDITEMPLKLHNHRFSIFARWRILIGK